MRRGLTFWQKLTLLLLAYVGVSVFFIAVLVSPNLAIEVALFTVFVWALITLCFAAGAAFMRRS